MKTQSIQVALPAELAEFARQDMNLGGYGDPSEYIRDLLRKRREERIQQDVAFLGSSPKRVGDFWVRKRV